jgi:hypothetical protein
MSEDWLFDMLKKNLSTVEPETPYEEWMTDFLRENLAKSEARIKSQTVSDRPTGGLLGDPEIQAALKALSGEEKSISIRQDAEDVLSECEEELREEILDQLDALVKRVRSKGGVIKSDDGQDDGLWTSILTSQLRAKIEEKQRKAAVSNSNFGEQFG